MNPATTSYVYNICNGFSNQLLYHAAEIAIGIEQGKAIEIPNYFIVNGVQTTDENVLPSTGNAIPFAEAFDAPYFLEHVYALGGKDARFVTFEWEVDPTASTASKKIPPPCRGMTSVAEANDTLILHILQAFRPSALLDDIITQTQAGMPVSNGVCVHHRDGTDWHNHCARWGALSEGFFSDGIYRGNCLGVPGRTFSELLHDRGIDEQSEKWIYYCGDHAIPHELLQNSRGAWSSEQLMSASDVQAFTKIGHAHNNNHNNKLRDLHALVDFFICQRLDHFIGNSVSTFSALQIALRDGSQGTYWYNSQSIPLSDVWNVYQVPIVYTYTESSQRAGKYMLKASIQSVLQQMPRNKIHILYHGASDTAFRSWLVRHNVMVHQHDPAWQQDIEIMRKNGNPRKSHLFADAGNYLGTWQRIDIPLFVHAEYCLLLDADTVVVQPFTLKDFGSDLTFGIAMSSEVKIRNTPSNAGVMFMNLPYLKRTHEDFLHFIKSHTDDPMGFDNPCPSDQGAYLDFYKNDVRFLDNRFNVKPYWNIMGSIPTALQHPLIFHFHGAKPRDYLISIMRKERRQSLYAWIYDFFLPNASDELIAEFVDAPYNCRSLQSFASVLDIEEYCAASFPHDQTEQLFCTEFFRALQTLSTVCADLAEVVPEVLVKVQQQNKRAVTKLDPSRILYGIQKSWFLFLVLRWLRNEIFNAGFAWYMIANYFYLPLPLLYIKRKQIYAKLSRLRKVEGGPKKTF